eukprot:jgi/Mesvir1/1460/Mv14444-RA.1
MDCIGLCLTGVRQTESHAVTYTEGGLGRNVTNSIHLPLSRGVGGGDTLFTRTPFLLLYLEFSLLLPLSICPLAIALSAFPTVGPPAV